MKLVVEKMDCIATMVEEGEYMVGQGGSILVGDRIVEKGEYCIDRNRVRVCKDTRYMLEDKDDSVVIMISYRDEQDKEILEETGVDGSNIVTVEFCIITIILLAYII